MNYNQETISQWDNAHVARLANEADCTATNEEAEQFLLAVAAAVTEQTDHTDPEDWEREMVDNYSGLLDQIAEGAVSDYTAGRWQQFVIALELIAYRLAHVIATDILKNMTDEEV